MIIHILFILNLLGLLYLILKSRLISIEVFVYFIFFYYGQSFYLDYIFFGLDEIYIFGLGNLSIHSVNFIYISFFYTLFSLSFILSLPISKFSKQEISTVFIYDNNKAISILIYIFFSVIIINLITQLFYLDRLEKIAYLTSNKLSATLASYTLFGVIFLLAKRFHSKNKSLIEFPFLLLAILYGLIEGGREVFIYLLLCFLFFRDNYSIKLYQIIIAMFIFLFLTSWKFFNIYVIGLGDFQLFLSEFINSDEFAFSSVDPKASILILSSYFDNPSFFNQFKFSYYYNTIQQFLSFVANFEYSSISKEIVKEYSANTFYRGGGFAFSGILESILNFSYFGPVILGFTLGRICSRISKMKFSDKFMHNILSVFFIIICMKLVRTELAVVLKLYLLPMIISYFIFYRLSFSSKTIINEN